MPPVYGFSSLQDMRRVDRAVNAFERSGPLPFRQRSSYPQLNDQPRIGIYNTDGANTIPPFGCVLISGGQGQKNSPDKTGPAQGICCAVKRPDRFGCQFDALIADECQGVGILATKFGAAQQVPPFIALYDDADGTPGFGEAWGPRSGTFKLKKNTGGFIVIGVYDSTNHYALVMPEPMLHFLGKTDAAHAKGASGTISIYAGTLGAETDTTINMTSVYNRFADVASGKWVRCGWDWWNNGWELVAAEC